MVVMVVDMLGLIGVAIGLMDGVIFIFLILRQILRLLYIFQIRMGQTEHFTLKLKLTIVKLFK
jgi:hypothetical protein